MSIEVIIKDRLTGDGAKVNNKGALLTQQASTVTIAPEIGTENQQQYLFGLLGTAGLNAGSLSQNVNGASTPQSFYMIASEDYDIHIMQITAVITDGAVSHSKFGAIAALTNGWDLIWRESGEDIYLVNKAKTTGQAIVQTGMGKPFGSSNTLFIIPSFSGADDAVIVTIPISEFVPSGARIGRGTTDKLTSVVNDDLTGLTDFKVYIYGYKNIPQG